MVGEPGVHQGQWSRGELDTEQEQWVHKHAQHDEEPSSRPQKVMRDLHRVVRNNGFISMLNMMKNQALALKKRCVIYTASFLILFSG